MTGGNRRIYSLAAIISVYLKRIEARNQPSHDSYEEELKKLEDGKQDIQGARLNMAI